MTNAPDHQRGMVEYILSRVMEATVLSQLETADRLDIQVDGSVSQFIRGEAEGISVQGDGLVIQNGLRVDSLRVQAHQLAIALSSAALGKPELSHPTRIAAQVALTEADLNQFLQSDFLHDWLWMQEIATSRNQHVRLDVNALKCQLLSGDRMKVWLNTDIHPDIPPAHTFVAWMILKFHPDQKIVLDRGEFTENTGLPLGEMLDLLTKIDRLLTTREFHTPELSLTIEHFEITDGMMRVWLKADVKEIQNLVS